MNDVSAISFRDVDFSYDSVPVLKAVSFSVMQGEFVSIVGPNGGGKTTLLYLMMGLIEPDRGEIRVFGKKPDAARRKIGYMPQSMDFDRQFPVTVMDVVLMGRLDRIMGGRYSKKDKQAAMDAMAEIGIDSLAKRPFSKLSGGQRQRVLIARTLACNPEILLLDEPTANVDPDTEGMMHEFLHEMHKRMTILLVSHDLGFVSKAVKSVICVNKRVVRHPTAEITPEAIRDLYKDEMRIVRHDQRFQNGKDLHG